MVNYYSELNKAVYRRGETFGPSLLHILLYSPLEKWITEKNKEKLRATEVAIDSLYEKLVLPLIPNLILGITGNSKVFPKDMRSLDHILKGRKMEARRNKLRDSYEKYKFPIDETTLNALYSEEPINGDSKEVKYSFRKNSDRMFSLRFKSKQSIKEKLEIKFSGKKRSKILKLVHDVSKDPAYFWENYSSYEKKYGPDYVEIMLGDFFGLKYVDLNPKRFKTLLEKLLNKGSSIKFKDFDLIKSKLKDHNNRLAEFRPGGIHYTLVPKTLLNYPVELKVMGLKSEIFGAFGPHNHNRYEQNGKKANGIYLN